jgi:hypothetical protein
MAGHRVFGAATEEANPAAAVGENVQRLDDEVPVQGDPLTGTERRAGLPHGDPGAVWLRVNEQDLHVPPRSSPPDQASVSHPRRVDHHDVAGIQQGREVGETEIVETGLGTRGSGLGASPSRIPSPESRAPIHDQQPALAPSSGRKLGNQFGREIVLEIRGAESVLRFNHRRGQPALLPNVSGE